MIVLYNSFNKPTVDFGNASIHSPLNLFTTFLTDV